MSTEHVGPSLWHGREINSCTRCKYLRCRLVKSGRHPDYDYFCMHPVILGGELIKTGSEGLLKRVAEKYPDRLEYFKKTVVERAAKVAIDGEFICNDQSTPEVPQWCPVLKSPQPNPCQPKNPSVNSEP